jgi:hypothetical protein
MRDSSVPAGTHFFARRPGGCALTGLPPANFLWPLAGPRWTACGIQVELLGGCGKTAGVSGSSRPARPARAAPSGVSWSQSLPSSV